MSEAIDKPKKKGNFAALQAGRAAYKNELLSSIQKNRAALQRVISDRLSIYDKTKDKTQLQEVVDALIEEAKDGNTQAIEILFNRLAGKVVPSQEELDNKTIQIAVFSPDFLPKREGAKELPQLEAPDAEDAEFSDTPEAH